MSQRRIADKNKLIRNEQTVQKHEIETDPEDPNVFMEVWVKELTFLDIQKAAQNMLKLNDEGGVDFSFEGYWSHAFEHFIEKTNPPMTPQELLNLKGFVGDKLSKVLPQPNELVEEMQGGFQNATETK